MTKPFSFLIVTALCLLFSTAPALCLDIEEDQSLCLKHECSITPEQLEYGLLYDLKPLAGEYIAAYEATGICPVFLAAKDALESGWGRHCHEPNNLSGYYTDYVFDSPEDCIQFVAKRIDENYLSENGLFHKGDSLDDVAVHYNGSQKWADEVRTIMEEIILRSSKEAIR
jgi:beta-N-acetylglucosaminidase